MFVKITAPKFSKGPQKDNLYVLVYGMVVLCVCAPHIIAPAFNNFPLFLMG